MMERVRRAADLPVPPADAWRLIADPDALGEWYGARVTGEVARPGERWEFAFDDGARQPAVLEEVIEGVCLSFRWIPLRIEADGSRGVVAPGRVELRIEPIDDGTRIVIEESRSNGGTLVIGA